MGAFLSSLPTRRLPKYLRRSVVRGALQLARSGEHRRQGSSGEQPASSRLAGGLLGAEKPLPAPTRGGAEVEPGSTPQALKGWVVPRWWEACSTDTWCSSASHAAALRQGRAYKSVSLSVLRGDVNAFIQTPFLHRRDATAHT